MAAGDGEAVHQIGRGGIRIEGLDADADVDSGVEARIVADEAVELGGADEQHRHEAAVFVFEREEPPELGEDLRRHDLGVVDDQNRMAAVFAHDREALEDLREHARAVARGLVGAELAGEALEDAHRIGRAGQHDEERGLEDLLFEPVEDAAREQRLAHAALARQQGQTLVLAQSTLDAALGVAMARALEVEPQIRFVAEGILAESEVLQMFQGGVLESRGDVGIRRR